MLTVVDLKQQTHPLPVQSKTDNQRIRLPNGKPKARPRFRPYPCYDYQVEQSPRSGRKRKLIDDISRDEHTLEIAYPLFKLMGVEKVAFDLIPEEAACAIKTPKHQRDNYYYTHCSFSERNKGMVQSMDLEADLVQLRDGQWAYEVFTERVYHTSIGGVYTETALKEEVNVGLCRIDGVDHIWKLSEHCQDVQLYEAYMDKKIRRHRCAQSEAAEHTGTHAAVDQEAE